MGCLNHMHQLNQRGVIHLLVPLILLAGIIGGVFLVTQGNPLKLFSKAGGGWLTIRDQNGVPYPMEGTVIKIKSASVKLEFYAPYGLKPNTSVSGPVKVYTVSYKIAENPADLTAATPVPMTQDPTQIYWTFKDPNPGQKFIWGEFAQSDGTTIRNSAEIELVASTSGFGKAIKFNNETSNNAYLVIKPVFFNITPPSEWTLEGWIKTPKPVSGNYLRDYSVITMTKPGTIYDSGYIFRLNLETQESNGDSRPMFKALLANWTDVQNSHLAYITVGAQNQTVLKSDTWNHIAITSATSGNKCTLKMYINGKLAESAERIMNPTCKISSQQPQEVWLAKPPVSLGGISGFYYPGFIDDARLSMGVVYTGNFTPPTTSLPLQYGVNGGPFTVALYHFDSNVVDSSQYHHSTQSFGNVQFVDSTIGQTTPSPLPTPSPTPTPAPAKRVFVTKYWVNGNINGFMGLAGANNWCKNQANQASLGGIWKAWLSNSTISAATNIINHNNGPYKLVNGTKVANNWADLIDGTLASKINRDQFGALAEGIVTWTNTTANGSINSTTNNCSNWTSTSGTSNSGNTFFIDAQWTKFQSDNCNTYRPLYCFEQ